MTDRNDDSKVTQENPDAAVIAQFKEAVQHNDPEAVERLLRQHPPLAGRIDEPWFSFDAPAIVVAAGGGHRAMVDVLLAHGADINARSRWWAGGFGVLHHDHYDLSRYLIERGARVDPYAAAALGLLDTLRRMIDEDPDAVNRRGPDGQVPLHAAVSPDVIDFLLERGADLDMRDIDHNGTPAQYAVNQPDKCRHLLARGAKPDMLMACKLGDAELVRRLLEEDPDAIQAQVGKGEFTAPGEHIYAYAIGPGARPLFLAGRLGREEIAELLLSYSSDEQRFLFACMQADAETVRLLLGKQPELIRSLKPEDRGVLADAAAEHRADAVRLMLDVGFDADARPEGSAMTALHRAALHGDAAIVRLLAERGASIAIRNEFGGTPLNSCIWGSLHFQDPAGDYAAVAEILVDAGVPLPEQAAGSESVKRVLVRHGVPA
ncbi:hypothetical protein GXP70_01960 [Paenibacillus lycopersici]|uniref:Uncharacterized protein n=1 Tax=Paenibacillus lycopersici TaxID=2704462 RepID=A0A6C0G2G7_9BACL|nr:ankyrin repeat domain-containing protein [Paenibacillus lycopersici]QHT58865.1 hypothetical protein GXP70_01960 [Paenibacillus lycopersici]